MTQRRSLKETEGFIVENYIGYEKIKDISDRKNIVRWIRAAKDKWLYVFEDIFYKFHVMGYEIFFEDGKWVVFESAAEHSVLQKGDIILRINNCIPDECKCSFDEMEDIYVDFVRNGREDQTVISVPKCSYTKLQSDLFYDPDAMPEIDLCSFTNIDKAELEEMVRNNTHLRIDLRNNMGGSINDMIEVLRTISNQDFEIIVADSKGTYHKKKVKSEEISKIRKAEILVGSGTASSAEIFIGYLSKICKVIILGEETVGKFVVHKYIDSEIGTIAVPVYKVFLPKKVVNGVSLNPYYRDHGFSQKDTYVEGEENEIIIK